MKACCLFVVEPHPLLLRDQYSGITLGVFRRPYGILGIRMWARHLQRAEEHRSIWRCRNQEAFHSVSWTSTLTQTRARAGAHFSESKEAWNTMAASYENFWNKIKPCNLENSFTSLMRFSEFSVNLSSGSILHFRSLYIFFYFTLI